MNSPGNSNMQLMLRTTVQVGSGKNSVFWDITQDVGQECCSKGLGHRVTRFLEFYRDRGVSALFLTSPLIRECRMSSRVVCSEDERWGL